jgi:hypothetical protein
MIGFNGSFFLFLFIAELPLAADADGDVTSIAGVCAGVSFVCCAPFILRKSEVDD